MSAGEPQVIPLNQVPIGQLEQLLKNSDEELEFFSESLQQLKMVQGKFQDSLDCLDKFSTQNHDKEMMVPLTSAMYVTGKLDNVKTVIVDIGTGYYVDMPIHKAQNYFNRRIAQVASQINSVETIVHEKATAKAMILQTFQSRLQQHLATQQQQNQTAS